MPKEIEAIMKGRVQLVMFRDFAQRKAKKFGLVGFVQNIENGSVKVVAQGREEKLQKFAALLKKGPILAKVRDIKVIWRDPTQKFESFNIVC